MKTINDLDVAGKTVLLRADFNVPLAKDGSGVITDDGRIVAALPTIKALTAAGAKVVIVAHLGRPKGIGFEASGSLAPAAALVIRAAQMSPLALGVNVGMLSLSAVLLAMMIAVSSVDSSRSIASATMSTTKMLAPKRCSWSAPW